MSSHAIHTLQDLPSTLQQMFEEERVYTPAGQQLPLDSNVSVDEALHLFGAVCYLRPAVSVEIGFAKGVSTLAITGALEANQHGHHHVIDPFQRHFDYAGVEMVRRAGLDSRLTFHEEFAEDVIPSLPQLDFAFIDSSHLYDLTIAEFVLIDKKLRVGGLLGFHDMWMPSLQQVLRYILSNRAYKLWTPKNRANAIAVARPGGLKTVAKRRLKRRLSRVLSALPKAERVFSVEARNPWPQLKIPNLVLIEKTGDDNRDWRFHRSF